ncbi:MAG: inositol monophosphatase [Candidatus Micrarchaeia archaeon]
MDKIMGFMESAVAGAAKMALAKKGRLAFRRHKDAHDFVTDADLAVEKYVVGRIRGEFPSHSVYSEEMGGLEGKSKGDLWILDPIDGTNNYSFGLPLWGVSLAYAKNGIVQAGAIAIPELGLAFCARKGKGAYCNGRKIRVSKRSKLSDCLVLFESRLARSADRKRIRALFDVSRKAFGIRVLGVAVFNFGFVALGSADISIMSGLKVVDFAAGALIVEEAGGKVTDLSGGKWNLGTADFAVSNGRVHRQILEIKGGK